MKTTIDFSEMPVGYLVCFNGNCPKCQDCLRFLSGQGLPDSATQGIAVYPAAARLSACPHFRPCRQENKAWGFKRLLADVKARDIAEIRDRMKRYLGGNGTYYDYHHGRRLLSQRQQQRILKLMASYGYADNLQFDGYCTVTDF